MMNEILRDMINKGKMAVMGVGSKDNLRICFVEGRMGF